jgi:hypothetical protein
MLLKENEGQWRNWRNSGKPMRIIETPTNSVPLNFYREVHLFPSNEVSLRKNQNGSTKLPYRVWQKSGKLIGPFFLLELGRSLSA